MAAVGAVVTVASADTVISAFVQQFGATPHTVITTPNNTRNVQIDWQFNDDFNQIKACDLTFERVLPNNTIVVCKLSGHDANATDNQITNNTPGPIVGFGNATANGVSQKVLVPVHCDPNAHHRPQNPIGNFTTACDVQDIDDVKVIVVGGPTTNVTTAHATRLVLNPINNVVQGTGFTVGGTLIDAVTNTPVENQLITFSGTGATSTLHQAITLGIYISAPPGSTSLNVGTCPIGSSAPVVPGCSLNADARGFLIPAPDPAIPAVNYVQLPVNSHIVMPRDTVAAKLRVQAVDSATQQLGTVVPFVAHVAFADGTGGADFPGIIAPDDLYLDIRSADTFQHKVGTITIQSIGTAPGSTSPYPFVPVTSINSYDPQSDPAAKYVATFDSVPPGAAPSPLALNKGTFVSSGFAPITVADDYSVQASFAGDLANGYSPSVSNVQMYSTLPQTAGVVGEPPATTLGPFTGPGFTNYGSCPSTNADSHHDGICNSSTSTSGTCSGNWASTTSTGGIPLKLFNAGDARCYNLGYTYSYTNSLGGITTVLDSPSSSASSSSDVYVELAYMANHLPSATAVGQVVDKFSSHSIKLHIIRQTAAITHNTKLYVWSSPASPISGSTDFQTIKANNFAFITGSNSKPSFYALEKLPAGSKVSGVACSGWCWVPAIGLGPLERTPAGSADLTVLSAKSQIYHFGLYAHNIGILSGTNGCGYSGIALVGGADFVIAHGCGYSGFPECPVTACTAGEVSYSRDTTVPGDGIRMNGREEAGTFAHELGHNLRLNHGDPEVLASGTSVSSIDYTMACKPNYVSVMSLSRQLGIINGVSVPSWTPDYNNFASPYNPLIQNTISRLSESSLIESNTVLPAGSGGIFLSTGSNPSTVNVMWGYSGAKTAQVTSGSAGASINWNGDANTQTTAMALNINKFGVVGCNDADANQVMNVYSDWANLRLNFRLNAQTLYGLNIIYPDPDALPELALGSTIYVGSTPPSITPSLSPQPNLYGWNTSPVTVSFNCVDHSGTGISPGGCSSPVTLSTDGAAQTVIGTASDNSGNSATTSVPVNVAIGDLAAPSVDVSAVEGNIANPISNGSSTSSDAISFTVAATDDIQVVSLECSLDGAAYDACPDGFASYSELALGSHTFSAKAIDESGNEGVAAFSWDIVQPASIAFDRAEYAANDNAVITVTDTLGTPGSVSVRVTSTTDQVGVDVVLSETGANTRVYVGDVSLSGTFVSGALQVKAGDTITAKYTSSEPLDYVTTAIIVDTTTLVLDSIGNPCSIGAGNSSFTVTGRLTDSSGTGVADKTITFTDDHGAIIASAITQSDGSFSTTGTTSAPIGTASDVQAHFAGVVGSYHAADSNIQSYTVEVCGPG